MAEIDIGRLAMDRPEARVASPIPRHRNGAQFLKGPVPWNWIQRAAELPGQALAVGLILWRQVGVRRQNAIALTSERRAELGVGRHTVYRALAALEKANLVSVERKRGRAPVITLLAVPSCDP